MDQDTFVESAKRSVDRAAVSLLVAQNLRQQPMLPEAVLSGALLFLLHRYMIGVLKGIGLDELAESHGKRLRTTIEKLRARDWTVSDMAELSKIGERLWTEIGTRRGLSNISAKGQEAVVETMVEAGIPAFQAEHVATVVAELANRD